MHDPFCGGGSALLEAQRLGLRTVGSDINPVAVLVSKALVEIPPVFAGRPPVNKRAREAGELVSGRSIGASGLADDVRYYGSCIRKEAERRIGHLYPGAHLPDGRDATVVAWLWARTVRSPDPAARGAHVPLVTTFMLSTKKGRQWWLEPMVDRAARSYRFTIRSGTPSPEQATRAKHGTKTSRGANFRCLLTGAPIPGEWIKTEGKAGRMGLRLLALVADGGRERLYLPPSDIHKSAAYADPVDAAEIDQPMPVNPRWFAPPDYGFPRFADLFTSRQIAALTTFSDLIIEARERVADDARAACFVNDDKPLHAGGTGAAAYADAVATYLAFALSKLADRGSSVCTWFTERNSTRPTFARHAIPMSWDFAELNTLLTGTGSFEGAVRWTAESLAGVPEHAQAAIVSRMEAGEKGSVGLSAAINTDPPYYDNIGYADLSDFFYVWLRRTLNGRDGRWAVWPDLFRAPLTPKDGELVATRIAMAARWAPRRPHQRHVAGLVLHAGRRARGCAAGDLLRLQAVGGWQGRHRLSGMGVFPASDRR